MMGTIGLKDQAMPKTDKVGHIAAQWDLTAELQAIKATVAQECPEQAFG